MPWLGKILKNDYVFIIPAEFCGVNGACEKYESLLILLWPKPTKGQIWIQPSQVRWGAILHPCK